MTRPARHMRHVGAALAVVVCMTATVAAQEYPSRQVRIIVPTSPGGGFDATARVFAEKLTAGLGQPVVIENRAGAGTLIGTELAARAAPDGYTMVWGGFSNFGINSGLYPKMSYDPVKDFVAVGIVVSYPFVLVARKDLPFKDVKDLIEAARARPGGITYASGGKGTGQHVAMAAIEQFHKITFTPVHYRGAGQAYQDVIGGRIDVMFDNVTTMLGHVEAGTVRPLAVSSKERMAQLPSVPTLEEAGGGRLEFDSWFGPFVPTGTPAAVIERLRAETRKVSQMPEIAQIYAKTGGRMIGLVGPQAEAFVKTDAERWIKVVRDAGITDEAPR